MLPKKHRLPGYKTPLLLTRGLTLNSKFFIVKYQKVKSSYQVGFVISKKVLAKAVDRNRLKRQLRHLVKEISSKTLSGKNYLFLTKPQIREASPKQISVEISSALKQISSK